MNYSNPTIARLLAKENLSVQHGNYKTAWFDIKNRTLGLPMWKDKGKDVYDLLVGHEVGHALHTPFKGWHDSSEKLEGCPRSYINVIEDARIERLVRNMYPGLVGPFSRGYKVLVEDGFFGDLNDVDYAKVKLIDKINLQCKLDSNIKVPFNKEELSFYARALSTDSFEEVVQLCRDILEYTKENQPELFEPPQLDLEEDIDMPIIDEEGDEEPPMGHDDMEQEAEDEDESDDCKETNNTSSENNDDDTSSSDDELKTSSEPEFNEEDSSVTDNMFRGAERGLLDLERNGAQKLLTRAPGKKLLETIITPFNQLMKEREWIMNNNDFNPKENKILEGFNAYMIGVKKASTFAVKEFELHKAAYQWQRAQTAKTGSLDMNKVHSYKFNEDIFKSVTRLADSKNHGMIMMIDYSGSMGSTIGTVIDQLMHLITFCKMVNIPFDVYAFTTYGNQLPTEITPDKKVKYTDGEIDFQNTSMPLLISSSLKKSQYRKALEHLYMKKQCCDNNSRRWDDDYNIGWNEYSFMSPAENWGSTPLNHALIAGHYLVKEFRTKHGIDKMNLIVLSDGDSNRLGVVSDHNLKAIKIKSGDGFGSCKIIIDGKAIDLSDTGRRATRDLAANISKRYGVKTLGFFVSDANNDWKSKLWEINMERSDSESLRSRYDPDLWSKANKEYRKNKCVVMQNTLGYDELYLVKGGSKFSTEEEDFEVSEEASNVQIRNAFKKFSKNKKLNKVLMTTLGKAVA